MNEKQNAEQSQKAQAAGSELKAPVGRVTATWTVELNCECPKCEKYVDLLMGADFWDGRHLEIAESKKGLEVDCPECGFEFEVDCEY